MFTSVMVLGGVCVRDHTLANQTFPTIRVTCITVDKPRNRSVGSLEVRHTHSPICLTNSSGRSETRAACRCL